MEHPVRQIRKELKLTQAEMAEKLGIGKSALSMIETGKAALSERNTKLLISEFNVNSEWIRRGKGEMFSSRRPYVKLSEGSIPMQSIPLYNLDKTDGLVSLFSDPSEYTPTDYIRIPHLPKCDGAVYIIGDGMYPILKSGDMVLYKQISDVHDIFWGDIYLISLELEGEEYILVRYIRKSEKEGWVRLVSQDECYADKEVQISRIKALALVKASVRINSAR